MEGATESEKKTLNELKKSKLNKSVQFIDLDGTGSTEQNGPDLGQLDPEKNMTVFKNLVNVDEKAQVKLK